MGSFPDLPSFPLFLISKQRAINCLVSIGSGDQEVSLLLVCLLLGFPSLGSCILYLCYWITEGMIIDIDFTVEITIVNGVDPFSTNFVYLHERSVTYIKISFSK